MAEKNNKKKLLIGGGIGVIALAVAAFFYGQSKEENNVATKSSVARGVDTEVNKIEVVPGESKDEQYNKLQEEENEKSYQQAQESGDSFIATIVNNSDDNRKDPLDNIEEKDIKDMEMKTVEPVQEPEQLTPMEEAKEEAQPIEEYKEVEVEKPKVKYIPVFGEMEENKENPYLQQFQTEYQNLESILKSRWDRASAQTTGLSQEEFYIEQQKLMEEERARWAQQETTNASRTTPNGTTSQGAKFIRKGTIVPAVIDIAINTDVPGPVMATIVSGPKELVGKKVIGEVTNVPQDSTARNQAVTVHFTSLVGEGMAGEMQIDAFAVDPKTSASSIASEVNNHNFRRYVGGLAATFIAGFGDAIANSGNTVVVTEGGTTIQQISKDTNKAVKAGLGNMGRKLGAEIDKLSDVPPTIYVHAGEPIGLLFMSDF